MSSIGFFQIPRLYSSKYYSNALEMIFFARGITASRITVRCWG